MSRLSQPTLALTCGAILALGACGSDDGDESDPGGGGREETALEVTVRPRGAGGPVHEATVGCPGQGRACELVSALEPEDFAPAPPDVACTQLYGGPQTAEIEGRLRGEPVRAELSRVNGCEISRWNRFAPLLAAVVSRNGTAD